MRWIQKSKEKIKRGDTDFPEGDAFFVDEKGSKAIVNGVLYVDGKVAGDGKHEIKLKDKVLPVQVKQGKVVKGKPDQARSPGGGKKNG